MGQPVNAGNSRVIYFNDIITDFFCHLPVYTGIEAKPFRNLLAKAVMADRVSYRLKASLTVIKTSQGRENFSFKAG